MFKLGRKVPLRRVVAKLYADDVHAMVVKNNPDIVKGHRLYPGALQKALTKFMIKMSDEDLEEAEKERKKWENEGPPMELRLK